MCTPETSYVVVNWMTKLWKVKCPVVLYWIYCSTVCVWIVCHRPAALLRWKNKSYSLTVFWFKGSPPRRFDACKRSFILRVIRDESFIKKPKQCRQRQHRRFVSHGQDGKLDCHISLYCSTSGVKDLQTEKRGRRATWGTVTSLYPDWRAPRIFTNNSRSMVLFFFDKTGKRISLEESNIADLHSAIESVQVAFDV